MNRNILQAEHLTFGYEAGNRILRDISLTIVPGKITVLLGANGCGKSTLFQLFTGRLKPESGSVFYGGRKIQEIKAREFAQSVAVVHQYNTAPEDITVRKLVEMGRTPYQSFFSYSQSEADRYAVDKALELTNTKEFEHRMLSQLSGGQKQRVWLALALAQEPNVLLLDEITTYLDIHYQIELLTLIQKLNREQNLTVFMILHDINQAMEFADEIVVMKKGEVIGAGNAQNVITEELLEHAFSVSAKIIQLEERKICLFSGKAKGNDL